MEHLSDQGIRTPVVRIGWPDQFIEHGTVPILREKHGLTAKAAVEKILALRPAATQRCGGRYGSSVTSRDIRGF